MNEDRKYSDYFIWMLAGVVIVLCLFVTSSMTATKPVSWQASSQTGQIKTTGTQFYFSPQSLDLKSGASQKVDLYFQPGRQLSVAGMDVIIVYDPQLLSITQSEAAKILPLIVNNKEKQVAGRMGWTFLNDGEEKYTFEKPVKILTLTIRGERSGRGELGLLNAQQKASTVITEDTTANKISFTAGKLMVNVK